MERIVEVKLPPIERLVVRNAVIPYVRAFKNFIEENDLCVRVYDHGQGFDIDLVPEPDLDELPERGRGLFLIRTLMDAVSYRRIEGGNVLEMHKRLT